MFRFILVWQNVVFVIRTAIRELRYIAQPAYRLRVESKTAAMRDGAVVRPAPLFPVANEPGALGGLIGGAFGQLGGSLGAQQQHQTRFQHDIQRQQMAQQMAQQDARMQAALEQLFKNQQMGGNQK